MQKLSKGVFFKKTEKLYFAMAVWGRVVCAKGERTRSDAYFELVEATEELTFSVLVSSPDYYDDQFLLLPMNEELWGNEFRP